MVSLKWPLTLCVQLTVLISWTCIIYCVAGYWVCFWWQREGLWWGCGLPVWHKTHCFIKHAKNTLYAFLVFPLSSSIDEGNRPRLLCKIGISPRRFQRDWFNQLSHIIIVWINWYSKFSTSERTDPVQSLRCLMVMMRQAMRVEHSYPNDLVHAQHCHGTAVVQVHSTHGLALMDSKVVLYQQMMIPSKYNCANAYT